MAVDFKRNDYAGHFPEIWRGECKILPGGFKPVQDIHDGTVLHKAVPIFVDFDNKTAAICKTAKVVNGGTTTKVRVAKGHYFVAGETVAIEGDGSATSLISKVDTSNSDYDVLELAKALAGAAADKVLFDTTEPGSGTAADKVLFDTTEPGSGTAAPKYAPNMVVGAERLIDGKGLPTIDAGFEAVILIPSLAAPMLADWLGGNGLFLKNNPNIIYIKQ